MVVLELEDYCQDCVGFVVDVVKINLTNNRVKFKVTCDNRNSCKSVYNQFEKYINSKEVPIEED